MAYYNKIGLLVLSENKTRFLVCVPGKKYGTDTDDSKARNLRQYLLPGGQVEPGESDEQVLAREIREELGCELNEKSLNFIGEYCDVAATTPDRDVSIRLYQGDLVGIPKPKSEIGGIKWVNVSEATGSNSSPIIKNKIVKDLVLKGILKSS